MTSSILVAPSVSDLLDRSTLATLLGEAGAIEIEALQTLGYSGSLFFRVKVSDKENTRRYIVKHTVLANDWFSHRTKDTRGREAAVLLEPALTAIHEVFRLPYRAVATEPSGFAVLMEDVSPWLFPDERKPLSVDDEALILNTLAHLHAAFWQDPALRRLSCLHSAADFLYIMGPHDHAKGDLKGGSARQVQDAVRNGWTHALALLDAPTRAALMRPAHNIVAQWEHLPLTLVHGDTKVANFAVLPERRLCAFDWAFAGRAPCTFDLGWYLAVNASRLSRSKEEVISYYRTCLERHLGYSLNDGLWYELEEAGIVCGALMLLWSKGAAVAAKRPGAEAEWRWWATRLNRWATNSKANR